MSVDFRALEEFPTFTGHESPQEQIRQLTNYVKVMSEQMQYLLQNIDKQNMNSAAWESMKKETLDGQTQQDVFNKLTDNGRLQGIYESDGRWYINAELVQVINLIAQKLKSVGKNEFIQIADGNFDVVMPDDEGNLWVVCSVGVDGDINNCSSIFSLCDLKDGVEKSGLSYRDGTLRVSGIGTQGAVLSADGGTSYLLVDEIRLTGMGRVKWEYLGTIGKWVIVKE